ncbi:hypothetical protein K440DRAFT_643572 [Wilcoxina mikolae CBS 423.85]|nr:hypothetical protein K440DRAFT_643572 [Wilcoxina mikolae CBS 423.85]
MAVQNGLQLVEPATTSVCSHLNDCITSKSVDAVQGTGLVMACKIRHASSKAGIFVGVPIGAVLILSLGVLFFLWRRRRRAHRDGVSEGLPVEERGEKQGAGVVVGPDPDLDTSKEPVPNQPYSENMVSPLPEHASSPRPPDIHNYRDPEAHAPEVYIAPPPLSPLPQTVGDIDQEMQMIEEEQARIRLRREMHQEVLRLQLEEERLSARMAELLVARGTR